jgi:hypothetical protein
MSHPTRVVSRGRALARRAGLGLMLLTAPAVAQPQPGPVPAPDPGAQPAPPPAPAAEPAAPAPAAPPAPPGSKDPDEVPNVLPVTPALTAAEQAAETASQELATKEAKTAVATATPLSAVRGGTLGFPAAGAAGVVAALKLQGGSDEATKFDFLAQIGRLELTSWAYLDVLGERVTTDVPSATYAPNTGVPLPRLSETNLTSTGLRLHLNFKRAPTVEHRAARSKCLTDARLAVRLARDATQECDRVGIKVDPQRPLSDEALIEAQTTFEEDVNNGFSLDIGGRFLYRSEETKGNAAGIAGEVTPQFGWANGAAFLSGSTLWLGDSAEETDGIASETAAVRELRATAGVYFRFNKAVGTTQVSPRIGLYGSFSRNFWTNRFAVAGTDREIRGYAAEGGVFASGHFSGGFNGLIQFGVRRDYGPDSKPVFIFAIVPSIGSDIGSAE